MIRNITRTWVALLLLVAASLVGPVGGSYAQTSAGTQYAGNLGGTAHGGTGGVRSPRAATLPFTGLDVGGLAGAGVALMAAGVLLRRRTPQAGG